MRGYWEEVTIYAGRKTVRQVFLEEIPGRANPEIRRKIVAKIIRGEKCSVRIMAAPQVIASMMICRSKR